MSKLLTILLVALVLEAFGVVLLSKGLKQIGEPATLDIRSILGVIGRGASNPSILLGVALEAVFFGVLLYLLSKSDVSLIWPLTALGFVITTLAAQFVLHEPVTRTRWCGVALIMIGAGLISWSEKNHAPQPPAVRSESVPQTPDGNMLRR